jgi:hypothetical protein
MHPPSPGIQKTVTALALVLMLATLWLLMRGYHGLIGDAQLYAFQALARIHPELAVDLYLQNTSQDQFTIFSPFYAWFIGALGLENAARLLTFMFTACFLAAAWSLARRLAGNDAAWLGIAFLLIAPSDYGGSGVFHYSELFLTARLPAEALVVAALACHASGMRRVALMLAIAALFVHPLMALPGLLLLLCMGLPHRLSVAAAISGILAVLGLAIAAKVLPSVSRAATIIDPPWLEVVGERSQFLLLQLWSFHDWDVNIRPFIYLGFAALAVPDERIRNLCWSAALIGAAGLAVALIGSVIGPVAVLAQGQAWRWVWIAAFVAALLLPVTVLQVWPDAMCGPLCALLLVAGWTWPAVDGTACASVALGLWAVRAQIGTRAVPYLRWAAVALGIGMLAWAAFKFCAIAAPAIVRSGSAAVDATELRELFAMRLPAVAFGALLWWCWRTSRTIWVPALLASVLGALSIFLLPAAFKQSRTFAAASDIAEFSEWRNAIPGDEHGAGRAGA